MSIDREFRGLWIATVSNLDFPRTDGMLAQKEELTQMVEGAAELGFNALVFQVRPEATRCTRANLSPGPAS